MVLLRGICKKTQGTFSTTKWYIRNRAFISHQSGQGAYFIFAYIFRISDASFRRRAVFAVLCPPRLHHLIFTILTANRKCNVQNLEFYAKSKTSQFLSMLFKRKIRPKKLPVESLLALMVKHNISTMTRQLDWQKGKKKARTEWMSTGTIERMVLITRWGRDTLKSDKNCAVLGPKEPIPKFGSDWKWGCRERT